MGSPTVNGHGPSPNGGTLATAVQSAYAPFFEEGPLVDVPRLLRALRRRRRLLVLMSFAGLCAAAILIVLSPPPYVATTTLLLRHPGTADPTRDMATDVQILTSRSVAERAMKDLGLHGSVDQFLASYTPTSLSDYVLRIGVKASDPRDALRRAGALAQEFLVYRRAQFQQQVQVTVGALEQRRRRLEDALAGINGDIGAALGTSGDVTAPSSGSDQLTEQLSRRTTVSRELDDIGQRIDAVTLEASTIVQTSRIVDPPATVDTSRTKAMVGTLAAGLILGLALGAGPVVLHEMLSDRVRRRSLVMAALGAPVMVSAGPLGRSLHEPRGRIPRHRSGPPGGDGDLQRIVRHLRGVLTPLDSSRSALVVVSVDSDAAAALALAALAHDLAGQKMHVLIADLSPGGEVADLLDVPSAGVSSVPMGSGTVWVACPARGPDAAKALSQSVADTGGMQGSADVVLALASVDPSRGADQLPGWAPIAVALVTAGGSSASALRSAGQLVRAAGLTLHSAVLIGADPDDETVGVMDGLAAVTVVPGSDVAAEDVDG